MPDLGEFFNEALKLPEVTKEDIKTLNFYTVRHDLSVYHLAYHTKKLKPSTIRRMVRRQEKKNLRKQAKFVPKSPNEI